MEIKNFKNTQTLPWRIQGLWDAGIQVWALELSAKFNETKLKQKKIWIFLSNFHFDCVYTILKILFKYNTLEGCIIDLSEFLTNLVVAYILECFICMK